MAKEQPSLEDLGLDGPVEKPFGRALDSYDSSVEKPAKTWVDLVTPDKPAEKNGVAAVLSFVIPGAGQVLRGRVISGFLSLLLISGLYGISLGFPLAFLLAFPIHLMNVYLAYSA